MTFPLFCLPLLYVVAALFFPDRWQYCAGLGLALILFLAAHGIGRRMTTRFFQIDNAPLAMPLGLGIILISTYTIASFRMTYWLIGAIWIVMAIVALPEIKLFRARLTINYLWIAPLLLVAFWSCFTPSTFYDAMVYHLGLPYQYVAAGKIHVIPYHWFSSFPPFEQTLNLLFVGTGLDSGIKAFSIILFLQIGWLLAEMIRDRIQPEPVLAEWIVIPLLLLPSAWIQIHIITSEILVSLFFVAGILCFIRTFDPPATGRGVCAALLLAFAGWTKPTALPYLAALGALWLPLCNWKPSRRQWRDFILVNILILGFLAPLLLRNWIVFADPLYPALSKILPGSHWTQPQELALQGDLTTAKRGFSDFVLAPVRWAFRIGNYGSASVTGIVLLVGFFLLFFAKQKSRIYPILIYVFVCYVFWFVLLRDFRQFFSPYLLLFAATYFSFVYLRSFSTVVTIFVFVILGVFSALQAASVYVASFPLISSGLTQEQYLYEHLDYFSAAKRVNQFPGSDAVLLLGETRTAYITKKVIASSAFDYNPFFAELTLSNSATDFLRRLKELNVRYVLCNWQEYERLAQKCGILPVDVIPSRFAARLQPDGKSWTGQPLARLTEKESTMLREFLSHNVALRWKEQDTFYFYELRDR